MIGMTNINKTVVVLGATGQQGGSVDARCGPTAGQFARSCAIR
jgi:hypothetical protein